MYLLAAGVQHVIVDATKYIDPLAVEAAWYAKATFWATIAAIAIATIAAIVAYRTLRYDSEQFKDFNRRPELVPVAEFSFDYTRSTITGLRVNVEVANYGDRPTRSFVIELLVPNAVLVEPEDQGSSRFRNMPEIGPCTVFLGGWAERLGPIYPTGTRYSVASINAAIQPEIDSLRVLWRIYDDYGNYPPDAFGEWTLPVKHEGSSRPIIIRVDDYTLIRQAGRRSLKRLGIGPFL